MIEIVNFSKEILDKEFLRRIAEKIIRAEGVDGKIELSIAMVQPDQMKELNKRYRYRDDATDILSFAWLEQEPIKESKPFAPEIQNLGEIVICPEIIKKQSYSGLDFEKELIRTLIHGILHLLGYDHEKGMMQAQEMKKKEDYYINIFNI